MEDFDFVIVEVINDISLAGAANYFAPIVDEVEKIKASYGKTLRATYIGREDTAPNFGSRSEDWQELSIRWRQRKNVKGDVSNRFYKGLNSGDKSLAHALFFLPGEKLFGRTTLRTRIEKSKTENLNRGRRQTVYRDDRGRYARADARALQNVRIEIDPFPNLARSEGDIIGSLPISDLNKMKLWASSEKRPLIGPYTEWFFERKIRAKIIDMAQRLR